MAVDSDDVPVTKSLLALVQLIQAAQTMFLNEEKLADHFGDAAPTNYWDRCKELFFVKYARHATAADLALDLQTFGAVMRIEIPAELKTTPYSELPNKFAFNPRLFEGRGGFKCLTTS